MSYGYSVVGNQMSTVEPARFVLELRQYVQHKNSLFSQQVIEVAADLVRFTSVTFQEGFRGALTKLTTDIRVLPKQPFIQVCEAIVEHHLRSVAVAERDLIGKSIFEAYVNFAGPQHVFERTSKTRFMRSLRSHGPKGFASLFLSLHLFNLICMEVCDEVSSRMPDQQTYELFMLGLETACRDVVAQAMEVSCDEVDEEW